MAVPASGITKVMVCAVDGKTRAIVSTMSSITKVVIAIVQSKTRSMVVQWPVKPSSGLPW